MNKGADISKMLALVEEVGTMTEATKVLRKALRELPGDDVVFTAEMRDWAA
jgi:Tfp pilus assembly pilus retraction ATPase PilT